MTSVGDLLEKNAKALLLEDSAIRGLREQGLLKVLEDAQGRQLDNLREIGESGDIDAILVAERQILENELEHHADSKDMRTSLTNGLNELDLAMDELRKVRDPAVYRAIDEENRWPKRRDSKGLPKDQARLFFASHGTPIISLRKSRTLGLEKPVFTARRKSIDISRDLYMALQRNALGREGPKRGRSGKGVGVEL